MCQHTRSEEWTLTTAAEVGWGVEVDRKGLNLFLGHVPINVVQFENAVYISVHPLCDNLFYFSVSSHTICVNIDKSV